MKSNTDVATDGALSKSTSGASHMSADTGNTNASSSSYDSGSQLHFFGLAVTQTQTQVASSGGASGEVDERSESRVCIHVFLMLLGLLHFLSRYVGEWLLIRFPWFRRPKGGKYLMILRFTRRLKHCCKPRTNRLKLGQHLVLLPN